MNSLILPLLVPFLTALVLALKQWLHQLARRIESADVEATLQFAIVTVIILPLVPDRNFGLVWLLLYVDTHGIQAVVIGGWVAPWGIAFVADRLACIMLVSSAALGTIVQVYTCWTVTDTQQKYFFYPLMQITLLGVNWYQLRKEGL